MYNVVSFFGIIGICLVAWLFSCNKRIINWRLLMAGIALQLAFAFFLFRVPWGMGVFTWLNEAVVQLLSFAKSGIYFVFGPLGVSPGEVGPQGEASIGFILATQALPTIIFFAALISLLYYLRVMPLLIKLFSFIFTRCLRVSGAESLCASSNIFVGVESAMTVRPFLEKMTRSELHTILTVGMSTIASSMLFLYVILLKQDFPKIAGHLISASVLSAIAAVIISKLVYPEDGKPVTLGAVVEGEYERPAGWIESIMIGAQEGLKLCVGIAALLIAFLGLLTLVNWLIGLACAHIAHMFGLEAHVTIERILAILLYPLVALIGVPVADIGFVSQLLGERVVMTEVVSYQHLAAAVQSGTVTNPRSIVLAAYALCGFAHIASLAIFVGGITALVPHRRADIAGLGFRALVSATLACLLTAAVAGVFYTAGTTVLFQ